MISFLRSRFIRLHSVKVASSDNLQTFLAHCPWEFKRGVWSPQSCQIMPRYYTIQYFDRDFLIYELNPSCHNRENHLGMIACGTGPDSLVASHWELSTELW